MADDTNEDSWLYGTSNPDSTTKEESNDGLLANEKNDSEAQPCVSVEYESNNDENNVDGDEHPVDYEEVQTFGEFEDPAEEMEEDEEATATATLSGDLDTTDNMEGDEVLERKKKASNGSEDDEDEDSDDDDDDINVVIGDVKGSNAYGLKQRSNLLAGPSGPGADKVKNAQIGKFNMEDLEGVGEINGVAAHEFSIDSLEEKPWRKPGADITDYFNYGFNEETWRAYCERQKRYRVNESGAGLASLTQGIHPMHETNQPPLGIGSLAQNSQISPLNDNMQMPPPIITPILNQPPPGRSGMQLRQSRANQNNGSKENPIQVMTAECREYSRSLPTTSFPPSNPMEDPFYHEEEGFDGYGYEPTQESQWNNDNPNWVPSGIKELTPGPNILQQPPPQLAGPPGMLPPGPITIPPPQLGGPIPLLRPQPIPGMMPPNLRMPPNINMGPPHGMPLMMGPRHANMPPHIRMAMAPPVHMMNNNNNNNNNIQHVEHRGGEEERERRRRDWGERERDRDRDRERERDRDRKRHRSSSRDHGERDRDYERSDRRDRERDWDRESERDWDERSEESERQDDDRNRRRRDRDKEREKDRDSGREKKVESSDREKTREREKEKDRSRKDRSRSKDKEKSGRSSKSRSERERSSKPSSSSLSSSRSEKKKSHRKDKEAKN